MKKEPTYREKIFEHLDKMEACIILVSDLCKPENKDKFLEVVKSYINEKGRGANGYCVEFNHDFSKIKKFDLIL